jgi:hypothetical protein
MSLNDHRNASGTYNGVTAMAEMTGLRASVVSDLWAEVKANGAKLAACPRHNFAPAVAPHPRRRTCEHCGGWVSGTDAHWYERGLEDAKK